MTRAATTPPAVRLIVRPRRLRTEIDRWRRGLPPVASSIVCPLSRAMLKLPPQDSSKPPSPATLQPSRTYCRRRPSTRLPSGGDGRRGAGGVLPPGHFRQPLGHIRPFRIQRARLLKGGGRV